MLVGVGRNQARIHCKPVSANEVGRDTGLDDTLGLAVRSASDAIRAPSPTC